MNKGNHYLKLFHTIGILIIIWLILKKIYFDNIPAYNKTIIGLGSLFEQMGFAFISGYVFYYIYEFLIRRPIVNRRISLVKNRITELVGQINKLCILFYITTKPNQNNSILLDFDDLEVNKDEIFWSNKIKNLRKQIYHETSTDLRTISPSYGDEIRDLMKIIRTNSRSIFNETLIFQHNDFIDFEEKLISCIDSDFFKIIEKQKAKEISRVSNSMTYRIIGEEAEELKVSFLLFVKLRNELYTEIKKIIKTPRVEYRNHGIDVIFKIIHNL